MLIRKQFAIITATAIAILAFSPPANAQVLPNNPVADTLGQSQFNANTFGAAFDPSAIDYDMQTFAPLDVSDYSGGPKARNGFFASYDRTYMTYSRAKAFSPASAAATPRGNTYQWGNHFNFGFTDEVGTGWNVDYNKSSGSYYTGSPGIATPMLTTLSMDSVSLNRLYRIELSRGGYVEPYGGARFLNLDDKSTGQGTLTRIVAIGPPIVTQTITGQINRQGSNNAIGGQLGMKLFQSYGRWTVSSDAGLSALYNSQMSSIAAPGFPAQGAALATGSSQFFGTGNTFVPVAQMRLNTTYGLTRDISLRLGGEFMWAWNGVNRSNPAAIANNAAGGISVGGFVPTVSQAMTLAGFSFGLEWRR